MRFRSPQQRIFAYGHPVDMRKGFNGLTALTQRHLGADPLSGDLFVFTNRNGTLLKILFWDRTGYCLVVKKLERGRFRLPTGSEKIELSEQVFSLIFDGIYIGIAA